MPPDSPRFDGDHRFARYRARIPENRSRHSGDKLRYSRDLTEEQRSHVGPLIPPAKYGGHDREVDVREVVNCLTYVLNTSFR